MLPSASVGMGDCMLWGTIIHLPAMHKLQKRQVLQLLQFACLKGSPCSGFIANALLDVSAAAKAGGVASPCSCTWCLL